MVKHFHYYTFSQPSLAQKGKPETEVCMELFIWENVSKGITVGNWEE